MTSKKTRLDTSGRPTRSSQVAIVEGLPNTLDDQLLHVFVIGPGVGESIVVRIPGGHWIVVDGCMVGREGSAPLALLRHYGVDRIQAAILTHPHMDHARGFSDLLGSEAVHCALVGCVDGWQSEPTLYAKEAERRESEAAFEADPERKIRHGAVEHALAAIRSRWESDVG